MRAARVASGTHARTPKRKRGRQTGGLSIPNVLLLQSEKGLTNEGDVPGVDEGQGQREEELNVIDAVVFVHAAKRERERK